MNIKPLNPNDAKALDSMSEESKAVIYYALKGLTAHSLRNIAAMRESKMLSNELFEYYFKIYKHTESLEMLLHTNQQPLTLACL